jgi:hypothetical protein
MSIMLLFLQDIYQFQDPFLHKDFKQPHTFLLCLINSASSTSAEVFGYLKVWAASHTDIYFDINFCKACFIIPSFHVHHAALQSMNSDIL